MTKKPVKETVNSDTNQPHNKKEDTSHHAEQKMNNLPDPDQKQTLLAQSPSQGCCPGCQKALGKPDSTGAKPIDKLPSDRQAR